MRPLVSILITSYNKADTIRRSIESALAQTYKNIQIIVIDDGSTDGTVAVLKNTRFDKRVMVKYKRHQGMMHTFNRGFSYCTGEYIATLDADDYWTDIRKIEKQLNIFKNFPDMGLVAASVDKSIKDYSFDLLLKKNPLCASTIMFRRSVFKEICDFPGWVRQDFITQDYPILLSFAKHSRIYAQQEMPFVYGQTGETFSQTRKRGRRLKLVLGIFRIKAHFILKYGCKPKTLLYVFYKLTRDILSVILKRWNKR